MQMASQHESPKLKSPDSSVAFRDVSNRESKILEMVLTHRKQRVAFASNREYSRMPLLHLFVANSGHLLDVIPERARMKFGAAK
jgi:hypothetical protein